MSTAVIPQLLKIEYSGPCRHDAEDLASTLAETSSVSAQPSPGSKASMAIGEIILTIAATAATKALISVIVDQLREYLKSRILKRETEEDQAPNLRVIVHRPASRPVEKLIALRAASVDLAAEFAKNLGEELLKPVA
jgi:hypothetical protein